MYTTLCGASLVYNVTSPLIGHFNDETMLADGSKEVDSIKHHLSLLQELLF